MLHPIIVLSLDALGGVRAGATDTEDETKIPAQFHEPVRLQAEGEYVRVEAPGYACPAWEDVNGDGRKDLVVGQFSGGKMMVYRTKEDGTLAAGEWLRAGGEVAQVPGVW